MLQIEIPTIELFDDANQEFINIKGRVLTLEHSLISLSKWESKWKVPFLETKELTVEQTTDYIKFMTIDKNIDPNLYLALTQDNIDKVTEYIQDPMTATWFNDRNTVPNREIITAEIIYYQMIALNIPFECQKWHLNKLLTLIKVCNIKNSGKDKKMKRQDIYEQNKALNEQRRKAMNTKG